MGKQILGLKKKNLFTVNVDISAGFLSVKSLDDQLRAIYSAALGMGVARGYYGAAYPAGECVDVLCPAGCTARRVSRGEKGGSCRKWPGFSRKNTS